MPIIRNPFRRQDENIRPVTGGAADRFYNGTPTKPVEIDGQQQKEPAEYQLSEINDSGVFVPPSPTNTQNSKPSFWTNSSSRSTTSSRASKTSRSLFDENEPFNISRESFDSYRRSFDISARSPVIPPEQSQRPGYPTGRASLDSRGFIANGSLSPPRHSNSFHRPLKVPGTLRQEEEPELEPDHGRLEDVALDDPPKPQKKRGMFSRIMDSDSHTERPTSQDGTATKSSWYHVGGRKRGQSGQGAELGSIPKTPIVREDTPKPESHLQQSQVAPVTPVKEEAPVTPAKSETQPTQAVQSKDETKITPAKSETSATPTAAEITPVPDVRAETSALR